MLVKNQDKIKNKMQIGVSLPQLKILKSSFITRFILNFYETPLIISIFTVAPQLATVLLLFVNQKRGIR